MEYVLTANALSKHYRHFKALNDCSMHVPKGAVYGIVGKNGAGKTTLLRLICGLQNPTSGEYTLYGISNSGSEKDMAMARRRMGAVVETPSIYSDMTAEDNLKMQYRVLGLPSFQGIQELLKLVNLENTGKKKAGQFSLGMRQRLGIAVALAGDPDFLVLDEPVNGLDPQGIIETRELILKLNRERQITVLMSSHILDELSRLATHYGFIEQGRMVKEISARELNRICRKRIRMEVTNARALARVLDKMEIEYNILRDERDMVPNLEEGSQSLEESPQSLEESPQSLEENSQSLEESSQSLEERPFPSLEKSSSSGLKEEYFHTEKQGARTALADIFARVNISVLAEALAEENCGIISLHEHNESLESYYMNLVGGGRHE